MNEVADIPGQLTVTMADRLREFMPDLSLDQRQLVLTAARAALLADSPTSTRAQRQHAGKLRKLTSWAEDSTFEVARAILVAPLEPEEDHGVIEEPPSRFSLPVGGLDPVDASQLGKVLRLATKLHPGAPAWQPVRIDRLPDGDVLVTFDRDPGRGAEDVGPVPPEVGLKGSHADQLAAWLLRTEGKQLLRFNPERERPLAGHLTPFNDRIRRITAEVLRCEPHEIALRVEWSHPGDDGELPHIATVTVLRAPHLAPEKRENVWRQVIERLPSGSSGWQVEYDGPASRTTLRWRQPLTLPAYVPLDDPRILPEKMRPDEWASIPIGIDPMGSAVSADLASTPHSLIIGPTGAGKSVGLLTSVIGALCRGHQLVVVDPTKAGLDFRCLQPWCVAWADDMASAQRVLEATYNEVLRRKEILKLHGAVKLSDVDVEVRRAERFSPLTVLVDEYVSMVIPRNVPKGLPRGHELLDEIAEANTAKAVCAEIVGRLAREARFVGIHLAVACQRPDASLLSGEMRQNLTWRVQLCPPGQLLSRDALAMVFDGDQVAQASATLALLDNGSSRGLAVVAAEGGGVRGVRVAHCPPNDVPALLARVGVPKAEPWDLTPAKRPGSSWGSRSGGGDSSDIGWTVDPVPAPEPVVVDVGELTFNLDDVEPEPDTHVEAAPPECGS